MNNQTIACVRSKERGIIYLLIYPEGEKPNFDVFAYCELLASQHDNAEWFVADASRYNVKIKRNPEND